MKLFFNLLHTDAREGGKQEKLYGPHRPIYVEFEDEITNLFPNKNRTEYNGF